jgi:hypothetical protein
MTRSGSLNRNIAGSARLVSYGTGPPGYIRLGRYQSANLAQPCLKLRLQSVVYNTYVHDKVQSSGECNFFAAKMVLLFLYLYLNCFNYRPKIVLSPTLYRTSDLCIPRNETAQPRSQFLHSCSCERFIYSQDRCAANFLALLNLLKGKV